MNAELFIRRPYGISLTKEGIALEGHASRVLALLDATPDVLSRTSLKGAVRVGMQEEYGQGILTSALTEFSRAQPKVNIVVRCVPAKAQFAALEADELDLAVVYEPDGPTSGIQLARDPTVWATSLDFELHRNDPVPVAFYANSKWNKEYATPTLERGGVNFEVSYLSETFGGFMIALKTGLAIVPISRSSIPLGCRELTEAEGFPEIDIWQVVLHRNPRSKSPAVQAMTQSLVSSFRRLVVSR